MAIDPKLIDQLLAGYKRPEEISGENGLLRQLTKAVLERALQAELTGRLGYEKHEPAGHKSGNSRNGTFEPKIVAPHQTRWTGFDDKIRLCIDPECSGGTDLIAG